MQLLTRGNEVFCLTNENEAITLEKMVGFTAACLYDNTICFMNNRRTDSGKEVTKERLELLSMVTNTLANALNATKK